MGECLNTTKSFPFQNINFKYNLEKINIIHKEMDIIRLIIGQISSWKSCETPPAWETSLYGSPLNNVLMYLLAVEPFILWLQEGNLVD